MQVTFLYSVPLILALITFISVLFF